MERSRAAAPVVAPPWGSAAFAGEPLVRISWRRYAAALRRYKWLLALVLLLGVAAGAFLARALAPEYEVHSTLWISSDLPEDGRAAPLRAGEEVQQTSWPDLLTSFAILDKVVRRLSLYVRPSEPGDSAIFVGFDTDDSFRPGEYQLRVDDGGWQYQLRTADGELLQSGMLGDSIGRSLGFRWRPPPAALAAGRTVEFTLLTPREAALALRRDIGIAFSRESNVLGLTLRGDDPRRITAVMSALIEEFIATAAELKRRNVTQVAKALRRQLDQAERELRDAEAALERFRAQTITLPSELAAGGDGDPAPNPFLEAYFEREIEHQNIQRDRQVLESTLAAVQSGRLDPSALWSVPAIESGAPPELRAALTELSEQETALREARRRFTDEHPTVRALRESVERLRTVTVPRLVQGVVTQLRRREQALGAQLQSSARQLRAIPMRTLEETRLRRNVEARDALFTTLKGRYEEATLAEASTVPDVSLLDPPVAPQHPSRTRAPYVILLAVVISLIVAVALALLLDRFDPRFRYAEQATEEMGLDVLGVVPALERAGHDPEEEVQLVEAFRGIRLRLMHAFGDRGRAVLTISSPGPGDGKSLVCSHLALSFAEAGCRTVLIDGDLRRGELHTRFGMERRPGLLDHLAGEQSLEQVLRPSEYENLAVIPRGASHARAPELLLSPRMSVLLTELARRFDTVIVDSPPLGAGIDPLVLATATGSLLLVLRSGETDRRMAEEKLELIERLPIRLLGVVLNDIRSHGSYPYYAYLRSDLSDEERSREPDSQVAAFARRTVLETPRER